MNCRNEGNGEPTVPDMESDFRAEVKSKHA